MTIENLFNLLTYNEAEPLFFNSGLSKMLATSIFTGGKQIIKQ